MFLLLRDAVFVSSVIVNPLQNSRARQKKYQGSKKSRNSGGSDRCGSATNNSGRSSTTTMGSGPGSPGCDGMMFPTSVTTSADDACTDKPMDSIMFSE